MSVSRFIAVVFRPEGRGERIGTRMTRTSETAVQVSRHSLSGEDRVISFAFAE